MKVCHTAFSVICASSPIAKLSQALIDTTNIKSPADSKKSTLVLQKNKKKGGDGPKPPVGVIPPPPSPPYKEVDTTINKGLLLLSFTFLVSLVLVCFI